MPDLCEISDLPRDQCEHCGARPGVRLSGYLATKAARVTVVRRSGRDLFPSAALPGNTTFGQLLAHALGSHAGHARCAACGRSVRNDAYGCDECADELRLTFADAPWWAEQIEISMTKQQAKRPGAGGRGQLGLPWRDDAAKLGHRLRNHLVTTVRLCAAERVRNSSPYVGLPDDNVEDMTTWLLWRVDGLTLNPAFAEILSEAQDIEDQASNLVDRRPDRVFLGRCKYAIVCGGVVFATAGEKVAKCRACGEEYDVAARREALEKELDDRLFTAAEIARLATYLGIPAERDVVRRRVNRWHNAGVIKPATWVVDNEENPEERTPRFRYGDVVPRLAATYDRKDNTA